VSSTVILRHGDDELEATAVRKEGHVSQQDIESNKYLGRILEQVPQSYPTKTGRGPPFPAGERALRARCCRVRARGGIRSV
jgi:hypothetical protein